MTEAMRLEIPFRPSTNPIAHSLEFATVVARSTILMVGEYVSNFVADKSQGDVLVGEHYPCIPATKCSTTIDVVKRVCSRGYLEVSQYFLNILRGFFRCGVDLVVKVGMPISFVHIVSCSKPSVKPLSFNISHMKMPIFLHILSITTPNPNALWCVRKVDIHLLPRFLHRLCQRTILLLLQVYHICRRRIQFNSPYLIFSLLGISNLSSEVQKFRYLFFRDPEKGCFKEIARRGLYLVFVKCPDGVNKS